MVKAGWLRANRSTGQPTRAFVNSTEMYLRVLLELEEEYGPGTSRSVLVQRLDIAASSVTEQVKKMTRQGLVRSGSSVPRLVHLTDVGYDAAVVVLRKHRLAERMLVDIIGLEWELCHLEASRWQHVLGEAAERCLIDVLDDPRLSPFGNPIPGLAGLDTRFTSSPPEPRECCGGVDLAAAARCDWHRVRVTEISELLQADTSALAELRDAGLGPGGVGRIVGSADGCVVLETDRGRLSLEPRVQRSIRVCRARVTITRATREISS